MLEKQKYALIEEIASKVRGGVLEEMSILDLKEIKMTIDNYKK